MDHYELVEKLREKANVSYEEAKAALEASNWDILDAMLLLEGEGRLKQNSGTYTTHKQEPPKREKKAPGTLSRIVTSIGSLIAKGNAILLHVRKGEKEILTLPLTVVILLLLFVFWWVVPIAVIGLFFGVRYSITGPNISETINRAMDKAADTVDNIKSTRFEGHYGEENPDSEQETVHRKDENDSGSAE